MIKPAESEVNRSKAALLAIVWRQLLDEALRQGFFGNVALEMTVQDGVIQHIRRRVERIEK